MTRLAAAAIAAGLLSGCGEWSSYALRNPATGVETECAAPWGPLSQEWNQRLWDCIDACEAKGFALEHPWDVPQRSIPVSDVKAYSVPLACR